MALLESPQVMAFNPPGRYLPGELRLGLGGDAPPSKSSTRPQVMWTRPQSPARRARSPESSINQRWNAAGPRPSLQGTSSSHTAAWASAPPRAGGVNVLRQSSNGAPTASAPFPAARPCQVARPRVVLPAASCAPLVTSLTYQAADSEDMERRSISGSSEIARAAFDRDVKLVQGRIQAVSLGGSCGPKISLRRLGLGEATMPFDWMRTRVNGLIHWLRHGFDDFLVANQRLETTFQETSLTIYRSPEHSFWHDDIQDEGCREKLRRRIDRFLSLASAEGQASSRPLLFVRGVAGSLELERTEELFEALRERFEVNGRKVWLLLILEDQPILGPAMHSKYEELVLWVQPRFEGPLSTDVSVPAPYEDAIAFTVRHILGDRGGLYPGEPPEQWPMVDQASDILEPGGTFWNAGCRETEVGLWVGNARMKGSSREVMLSAFEGVDKLEGSSCGGGSSLSIPSQGGSSGMPFGSVRGTAPRDPTPIVLPRRLGGCPSLPVVAN